jgi:hypothetical protein
MASLDLHCVSKANVNITNANTYNSTLVGSTYIRGLESHQTSTGATSSYTYRLYVTDIQNKSITFAANGTSSTANTIKLPVTDISSTLTNAYVGVTISIVSGLSRGDSRTIVSYNGSTRIATVDSNFTVTPDATSVAVLKFNIKDIEGFTHVSSGTTITSWASSPIDYRSNNLATGDTLLQNKVSSELVYNLGNRYVKSISDTSYQSTQVFKTQNFSIINGKATTTLNFDAIDPATGDLQFLGTTPENYIVIDNTTKSIVSFANTISRHINMSNSGNTVTLIADDLSAFSATIITKASLSISSNDNLRKIKNLKVANTSQVYLAGTAIGSYVNVDLNTGQTYIKTAGLVTAGQPQSLYVSDVKRIIKIIDTGSSILNPTNAMLSDPTYDVTYNFTFDNGQRDSWYQHASIKLISGRPTIKGQLLILFDYYEHSGGNAYFSTESYISPHSSSPENYSELPTYTAKSGVIYSLRDAIDFRPAQKNAQALFTFGYTGDKGYLIPLNNSVFTTDYSYYLGRKDKLILTKDKNFEVINGNPSLNPISPVSPDGALVIANITLDPYTSYVPGENPNRPMSNLSIEKVQHKRWTMSDISELQSRINNIEYYTALNNLEKSAQGMQIPDVNGLNRFKNGILVDDFSSFYASDTNNIEFNVSIDNLQSKMSASQIVDNFPLHLNYPLNLDKTIENNLGYKVHTIGQTNIFTLPYTSSNIAAQTFASTTINVNPYATPIFEGSMTLNPPMDNWVDNTKQPDLLIVDPNLTLFQASSTLNTLSVGPWKTVPGSKSSSTSQTAQVNHVLNAAGDAWAEDWGFGMGHGVLTTTTQTYEIQSKTTVTGYWDKLGSSYSQSGGYITDISILPYIRNQQLLFRAQGLAHNTPLSTWFDGVNVDKYITNPDIIELTNVSGNFSPDDVIGYFQSSVFYPLATIASVYTYPDKTKIRLYIVGNFHTSIINDLPITTLQNAFFNSAGAYTKSTANGKVTSTKIVDVHKTGYVTTVGGTFINGSGSNFVKYYRVKVAHGIFSDQYGIWGSPKATGNLPAGVFNFNVPATGTYTMRVSTDDAQIGYIKVNGVTKWTASLQSGSFNDISLGTLTAGTSNCAFSMTTTEDDGDAYAAIQIFHSTNKNTIFGTDLPLYFYDTVNKPTTAGTVIALTGGGLYFVGVTEMSLSGLASEIATYYVGCTISVHSQFITTNPNTSEITKIPQTYTATILSYVPATATITLSSPINISFGTNSHAGGDITSYYSLTGTNKNYNLAVINGGLEKLSSDESGSFVGVLHIPENMFKTGDRVFKVDNRTVATDPKTATTYAQATFTASGLSTKSQAIDFAPSIDAAKNTFTQTQYSAPTLISTQVVRSDYDPVAQTFIIDSASYPNGAYIKSIKVFFKSISTTNTPITLSVLGTQNGYPNGETLDNSVVTKYPADMTFSNFPHYLDSTTFTEFVFLAPLYIRPDTLYAFMLKSVSTEYNVYIAGKGDVAINSSVKNLPTDATPTVITKIGNIPYIGNLFESQNAMTWTADQGKSIMFIIDRCKFDTSKQPKIPFVVPKNLPYRKLTTQNILSYYNPDNLSNIFGSFAGKNIVSHAYNLTTTDFVPSSTNINYTYQATINDDIKTVTPEVSTIPGKFGCPTYDDLYLNDNLGERILIANSNSSFSTFATLSSSSDILSPILADDGLSLYNIRWTINNLELANSSITITSGGTGYNVNSTIVSVSAPSDIYGTQAYATANISGGIIQSLDWINYGSGYQTNPIITITDPTTRSGNSNASIIVHGESSPNGGNGISKYFTKKVVLSAGNHSGDLRVFYTAYRPYGTNISVYYKILNENDTQAFDDSYWQLMTNVSNSNTFSDTRNNIYEFEAAPGTNNSADNLISYTSNDGTIYSEFSQFSIKIILSTNDKTFVPFLTDIRVIAVPAGTGL